MSWVRDIVMRGNDRQELVDWGERNGLIDTDEDGNKRLKDGFDSCRWADTGQFMRTPPGPEGNPPATYINGYFQILRFLERRQAQYNQLIETLQFEGQEGDIDGITFYRWDGVEFCVGSEVLEACEQWGVPYHEWSGGNEHEGVEGSEINPHDGDDDDD